MRRASAGFTLIELLVVIAIILILAGLLLGAVTMLRGRSKEAQTRAILALILQVVETQRIDKGGVPAASEHPLAGTAPPAAAFRRADGTAIAFAAGRPAIAGLTSPAQADPLDRDQLAFPDDRFSDPLVPLLFGLRRDRCQILGPAGSGITWLHRVVPPAAGAAILHALLDPTTAGYPRIGTVVGGPDHSDRHGADQTRTIDYLLGAGGCEAELVRLGGLRAPPDDQPAQLARSSRVWTDPSLDGNPACSRLADGQPYLLRGKAFYDAFGHEILYRVLDGGTVQVASAGRDGAFATGPGRDGILGTADDPDASSDNLILPQEGRP